MATLIEIIVAHNDRRSGVADKLKKLETDRKNRKTLNKKSQHSFQMSN